MGKRERKVHELRTVAPGHNNGKLKVAVYCRVSSDSEDQINSYSSQISHYTKCIEENPEWELADIYADEGVTGTRADSRDGFNRLMADCGKGRVDLVIVKSVSRFARNTKDCLDCLHKLKGYGTAVVFEKENIDTSKLKDELTLTMYGLLAEQESHSISKNLRQSYIRRMRSGEFNTCTPPTGYSLSRDQLTVKEDEAKAVCSIFDMFLSGMGKQKIADILNDENACKRTHKRWTLSTVDYILRNERYMGEALLQKRYTSDELPYKRKKNNGERDMYHVTNSNPPIIGKDVFEAAQSLVKKRAEKHGSQNAGPHPFNRKIACPDCGRHFRRKISGRKACWVCSYGNDDLSKCTHIRIEENSLKETFALLMLKLASRREYIIGHLISQLATMQLRTGRNRTQIYLIDKEIAALETRSLVHARLKAKGALSGAAFAERENEASHKLLGLRRDRIAAMKGDADEEAIAGLKELGELLSRDIPTVFDGELFSKAVVRIVPADAGEMNFELLGGLAVQEWVT